MLHARVTHTLTFAFILSALPPLSLLLYVSLCVLPFRNLPGREVRKWGEEKKEKKKKHSETSLQNLPFPLSHSRLTLPLLLLPPCSSQWDVLTLCKRCACSFAIQSAKPIDPLTTCCSTSFTEEQVCTCTVCIRTGVYIPTEKASPV